jgi:hypothetical protein
MRCLFSHPLPASVRLPDLVRMCRRSMIRRTRIGQCRRPLRLNGWNNHRQPGTRQALFAIFDSEFAIHVRSQGFRHGRDIPIPCQQYGVTNRANETSGNLPPPRLLAAARALAGLSQRELATEAGVAASSIGRYEAGLSRFRSDSFEAILGALRRHGIRFIDETPEVAMGVYLIR